MDKHLSHEDELPPLLSGSHISPSTHDRDVEFDFRNSEDVHKDALAAAKAEHRRVRDSALRAFELNELRQANDKLHEQTLLEEERVRIETERLVEQQKLRELQHKASQIAKQTPPRAETAPELISQAAPAVPSPEPLATLISRLPQPAQTSLTSRREEDARKAQLTKPSITSPVSSQPSPVQTALAPLKAPASSIPNNRLHPPPGSRPFQSTSQAAPTLPLPSDNKSSPPLHVLPGIERYAEIHQSLKKLRSFITNAGKQDPAFKKKTGEMRRAIRQSVGQLTEGKGANKLPTGKITGILKEALTAVSSPLVDPGMVVLSRPKPSEDAGQNVEKLPALFIYLLNVFSKAVIAQFVDEAGVAPKTADPIGVAAVTIFSRDEFCWRGKSLIDILIAKIRVVCPVLFGIRGSEKTEEGRARLGWKKDLDGHWIGDQIHNTRMTGLGAGYAAISLRDFSKSRLQNPWPPTHYWQTIASIVSTPPDQTSSTQYTVLKALIENYEQKFMNFYGHAARAALQVALVDFPGRALEHNVAATSLKVLGDKLKRDTGLQLQH